MEWGSPGFALMLYRQLHVSRLMSGTSSCCSGRGDWRLTVGAAEAQPGPPTLSQAPSMPPNGPATSPEEATWPHPVTVHWSPLGKEALAAGRQMGRM